MKLYNTPAKQVEDIVPQNAPEVTVYSCGPTVYDYAHIGHWFTYVRTDILIRTLKASGFTPNWVMNITDVGHLVSDADEGEDKLEKGAKREGKTAWEIADFYTKDFLEGMQLLNISQPTQLVKATDNIAEQIDLIKVLELKGYTYKIDDGIYFDTSKFKSYGVFAHLQLDAQQATGRVASNPQKHQQSDFAVWKFSPKGSSRDMEWDSPWGIGFPGWHIECSAMSMKYLGETLDLHTGGVDHIPVHHTNEIAQSEAATEKKFVNHWMHSNHVMVNDEKISKSLGNGIHLQAVIEKGISPMAVRLLVLESHYRSHAHFSWDSLEAAQTRLKTYQNMANLRWQYTDKVDLSINFDKELQAVRASVADDLNTPQALALISELEAKLANNLVPARQADSFEAYLGGLDDLLGLNLRVQEDIADDLKVLLSQRADARSSREWDESDKIRGQLLAKGIGVKDTPDGQIWFRL